MIQINILNKKQLRIYFSNLEKRQGICSQQYKNPDKHALLWDFDNVHVQLIEHELRLIQADYHLPPITVIQSSPVKYHAYCFVGRTFREIIHILSATPSIDIGYLKLGIVRGYFTLRIVPRKGEKNFKLVKVLLSPIKNEVSPEDLTVNEYITSNTGQFNNETKVR